MLNSSVKALSFAAAMALSAAGTWAQTAPTDSFQIAQASGGAAPGAGPSSANGGANGPGGMPSGSATGSTGTSSSGNMGATGPGNGNTAATGTPSTGNMGSTATGTSSDMNRSNMTGTQGNTGMRNRAARADRN